MRLTQTRLLNVLFQVIKIFNFFYFKRNFLKFSGWILRSGITNRTSLYNVTILSSSLWGPNISTIFPLGSFNQDYGFNSSYGDLDICNGHWTLTPDYRNGTYAYFTATDSFGNPIYTFFIGPYYNGYVPTNTQQISETKYTYYSYVNSTATATFRMSEARCDIDMIETLVLTS